MTMSWPSWLAVGFVGTMVLTTMLVGSQGLGFTRMSIPYMLGTIFTPNRDRAKVYGTCVHVLNGWIFALIYIGVFHALHRSTWWLGMILGLLQSLFVLTVVLPVLPGIHPRMASEQRGPTVVKQLEPPGFLGLHYGARTPLTVILSHLVFGALLGALYTPR